MFIKYVGGRTHVEVSLNRKPYYFSKEKGMILETKDQSLISYIFSLPNRMEFQVVEPESPSVSSPRISSGGEDKIKIQVYKSKNKKFKKGGK